MVGVSDMYEVAALGRGQLGGVIRWVPTIGIFMLWKVGKERGRSEG
jgi:hypothetical protein